MILVVSHLILNFEGWMRWKIGKREINEDGREKYVCMLYVVLGEVAPIGAHNSNATVE